MNFRGTSDDLEGDNQTIKLILYLSYIRRNAPTFEADLYKRVVHKCSLRSQWDKIEELIRIYYIQDNYTDDEYLFKYYNKITVVVF